MTRNTFLWKMNVLAGIALLVLATACSAPQVNNSPSPSAAIIQPTQISPSPAPTTEPVVTQISPSPAPTAEPAPKQSEGLPDAIALGINEHGQIVGRFGNLRDSVYHAHAFLWSEGVTTDLGTLGGATSSANAINNRGAVVGKSDTASGDSHAFLWQDNTMIDLGTLGGRTSEAIAINERGQVVGLSDTGDGGFHAFLWQDGTMIDLGTPSDQNSKAVGINEHGQIILTLFVSSWETHVGLWEEGSLSVLGTNGSDPPATADGINDNGAMIGALGGKHGFIWWEDGRVSNLAVPDALISYPWALNNKGQVVGFVQTTDMVSHAVLWQQDGVIELGTLGGEKSVAMAINEHGQIVGGSDTADNSLRAFIWENGAMKPVSVRIDISEAH